MNNVDKQEKIHSEKWSNPAQRWKMLKHSRHSLKIARQTGPFALCYVLDGKGQGYLYGEKQIVDFLLFKTSTFDENKQTESGFWKGTFTFCEGKIGFKKQNQTLKK